MSPLHEPHFPQMEPLPPSESMSGELAGGDAELLGRFLRDRDVDCPRCGYNLRNLQGGRCPECGDELVLRVNLAEPRLAPLITGLVGLSAGAGLNGLLILYGLIRMMIEGRFGLYMTKFFVCTGIGFVALGYALRLWMAQWPKIRRAPRPIQWRWAFAAWGLTLTDLVLFSIFLK